jgi:dUTP pyrophosphatase
MKYELRVRLLNKDARLPIRADPFSAGADVFSCEDFEIEPYSRKVVKTGLALSLAGPTSSSGTTKNNYYIRVAPRSGLSLMGIDVGAGVIDSSYRGEVGIVVINNSPQVFKGYVGQRVAQLIVEKISVPEIVMATGALDTTARGENGFGSTGQ